MLLIDNIKECFRAVQQAFFRRLKRTPAMIVIGIGIAIVLLWVYTSVDRINIRSRSDIENDVISCHNKESDDDLPPLQNHRLRSKKTHIYFQETTCNGFLQPRQTCVVESAARLHPNWQINVIFSAPMNMTSRAKLNPFQEFSNVKFWRVNILKYLKNTPLEYLVTKHHLKNSYYPIVHTADVLRLVTLYNWDGVYLDLDALLVKPLDDLEQNFVSREHETSASNSVLAFSNDTIGRSVAKALFREIETTFNGTFFNYNGPGAVTRMLQRRCSTMNVSQMSMRTCNGLEVYGPSYFYSIPWQEARKYFEPGNLQNNFSYGYHFWNYLSKSYKVAKSSTIAQLAKKYCPFTYNLYKKEFGF